jgi:hypothetical protein
MNTSHREEEKSQEGIREKERTHHWVEREKSFSVVVYVSSLLKIKVN